MENSNTIHIEDIEIWISDIQDVLLHPKWIELYKETADNYKQVQSLVLLKYLDKDFREDQVYNQKHRKADDIRATLEIIDAVEEIKLPWIEKFVKHLQNLIWAYETLIKKNVGWSEGITMAVSTETDLEISHARHKVWIVEWFNQKLEKLKKPKAEDNVMDRIRED